MPKTDQSRSDVKSITKPTRQISISCHEAALPAWKCWQSIQRQSLLDNIPLNIIESLQSNDPLWVINSGTPRQNKFKFFHGFAFSEAIKTQQISSAALLIHSNISDQKIQETAWEYILRTIVYNLDRDTGLGSLYTYLNDLMPYDLMKNYFGRRKLSKKSLADLAGIEESAVRWEVKKVTNAGQADETILSSILRKL